MCKSEPWGGIIERKLEAPICFCSLSASETCFESWLSVSELLLLCSQLESLLLEKQQYMWAGALTPLPALGCYCKTEDPDKRKLASFWLLKKENASFEQTELCILS